MTYSNEMKALLISLEVELHKMIHDGDVEEAVQSIARFFELHAEKEKVFMDGMFYLKDKISGCQYCDSKFEVEKYCDQVMLELNKLQNQFVQSIGRR